MKNIVLIVLLMVHFIKASMIFSSTFPLLGDSEFAVRTSRDAFMLACTIQNWKILSAIQIPSAAKFPFEFFALQDDPEFEVIVQCSTKDSMKVTFLAPRCETMYEGLAKNPIVFQIDRNQPNSSQVHIQLISTCPHSSNTPSSESAHINHASGMWYLIHRSVLSPIENNIKFGLIVFEPKIIGKKKYQRPLEIILDNANTMFFNRKLKGFVRYNLFKMGNECDLSPCYDINVNQSTNTPFTTATNDQDTKMQWHDKDILTLLFLPVIIGLILLGMIIIYTRKP